MAASVGVEAAQSQAQSSSATKPSDTHGGFNFHDILEVINPLQHIPVISTVYRELTGDTISPAARIAGDALYGGVWGLASSVINEVVEGETGKDIGGHIWATLFGDDDDKAATTPTPVSTGPASTPAADAASAMTGPPPAESATPPAGPTSFFQTMQHASHASRGVPLSTTVPMGATHSPLALGHASPIAPATGTTDPLTGADANAPTSLLPPAQAATTPGALSNPLPNPLPVSPSVVPQGDIAAQMMKALDKYKAMQEQDADGVPATMLVN